MKHRLSTYLRQLEAESIQIMREVVAEFHHPVMLYSIGKDSSVMVHLAMKAFYPAKPPFPLLHVDTTWKFREMIAFRDREAKRLGVDLMVHTNEQGVRDGISPITHGSALYTDIMKTQSLKQALERHHFDAAFGGARRDEEKSRAKERVFSFRNAAHNWDPKRQRPELWHLANTQLKPGESMRVFPLSNWTELDVWTYIYLEDIPVVPLYFAAERPVVERGGMIIMVDDDRLPMDEGEKPEMRRVRFRTLGCYPLSGAIEFECDDGARDHRRAGRGALVGASGPCHRPRSDRVDGEEEAGRVFLMPRLSVVDNKQDNAEERLKERLAAEENRTLLNFLTCGSVDDGKSTLIGRLLFDSAQIYEDQLKSAERELEAPWRQRRARPRASGRRPPGRARAEDHHRRCLSLFLDAAPQIHRRRYAWPCAVHAQHGDGRFELRLRRAPGRCARWRAHANAAACLHRLAARHPQARSCRQQDGPRRFQSGALRRDCRRLQDLRRAARL